MAKEDTRRVCGGGTFCASAWAFGLSQWQVDFELRDIPVDIESLVK